ncbi:hypothetical protein PC123_g29071 [Phytophthora cactorum]|nr:hypothetical protein PC123_g29071 [Phytophthora cactorum]
MAETQTGKRVKTLRSDNGGEYTSGAMAKFCKDRGIEQKFCWQDDASTSCGIPVDTGMTITQWDRNHSCDYGTLITGR